MKKEEEKKKRVKKRLTILFRIFYGRCKEEGFEVVLIMNIVNCKYVFTVKDTWNTIVRGNYSILKVV